MVCCRVFALLLPISFLLLLGVGIGSLEPVFEACLLHGTGLSAYFLDRLLHLGVHEDVSLAIEQGTSLVDIDFLAFNEFRNMWLESLSNLRFLELSDLCTLWDSRRALRCLKASQHWQVCVPEQRLTWLYVQVAIAHILW